MDLIASLSALVKVGALQTRQSEFPAFEDQLAAIRRSQNAARPWRSAGIGEALGVPAILGAVSLISNTVGTLALEGYRQGILLEDDQRPRLIVRPNPFSTPRDFFRDSAFYLATRGEAWWWVAARDIDGAAMSLYPIPPWEITVQANDRNRLRPTIKWLDRQLPNEDIRHITYLPDHSGLRGVGPLQLAGAAVSVTVEADNWAANFFSGSVPSIVVSTEQDMSGPELEALAEQWAEKPSGTPRFLTSGLKLENTPFDAQKAQLSEARQHQVGETARMFLIPGALLEYQMSGSSLTYQNQEGIWSDFQKRCLSPNYLEPIEQEISDLLTRSTSARFNVDQLLRGDSSARSDFYSKLVPIGVMTAEEARAKEGLAPGAVDFAPVPQSPSQAIPALLPPNLQLRSTAEVICIGTRNGHPCKYVYGQLTAPYHFICPRCKTVNAAEAVQGRSEPDPMAAAFMALATREQPAPQVNVTIADGAIQNHAAPPEPVTFNLPDQPAPVVNLEAQDTAPFTDAMLEVRALLAEAQKPKTIVRDDQGRIVGLS